MRGVTRQQGGRLASVCRLFVPMYRQSTIRVMRGKFKSADWQTALADIEAAWADYLARDSILHQIVDFISAGNDRLARRRG